MHNLLFDLWPVQVEDLGQVFSFQHLVGVVFVEEVESHSQSVRGQHVLPAVVEREVAFVDLELPWLRLCLVFLKTLVSDLREFVQFEEELADHLLFDWLLVGLGALDLVPKLDLHWLTEGQFDLPLARHVELNEGSLANIELLEADLAEKDIEWPEFLSGLGA